MVSGGSRAEADREEVWKVAKRWNDMKWLFLYDEGCFTEKGSLFLHGCSVAFLDRENKGISWGAGVLELC